MTGVKFHTFAVDSLSDIKDALNVLFPKRILILPTNQTQTGITTKKITDRTRDSLQLISLEIFGSAAKPIPIPTSKVNE
jgi:SpoU rRNA methylase family enzyme